jgi:hypothetical protein
MLKRYQSLMLAAAMTVFAGSLFADNVTSWNIGNGQANGNFQVTNGTLAGGTIQLGLRAVMRQGPQITPIEDDYYVPGGSQIGVPNRAAWNFDYSVYYEGVVANLDSLTLTITTADGSPVGAGNPFNLLAMRGFADCHMGTCAHPAEPTHYLQDSQNPVFAPWFEAPFSKSQVGTYHFVLAAKGGDFTASTAMDVIVTPEPAELTLALVLGFFVLIFLKRKRTSSVVN